MASKFVITAELSLQTKNLNQVVRNLQSQFNNANLNVKIKDLAQAQSQIQKISSNSRQASKDVGVLGNSMEQAFKRFTVITAVTGTLVAFTRAIKNSIKDAISFEREIVKISQATGQTVSQLQGLVREINDVSTSFGVSSEELILASRSLTQAGFAADKVAGSLKILAQTELAATFDSIQDTTEGIIALLNQFGREAQKSGTEVKFLEQSFSAINQVSKEFAVESSDLVTAIRTTGSAFESAGGNLNELLALFTSVRSTTRESAESISTGFRTIFTRVQRVDTINALRNLGIELQDAEGKFVRPLEAVKRLSVALNTIDPKDFRFNMIVEELGGFRQVSKVIPLIQQFAVTQKALNTAQGASGSLAEDAKTAQQALAIQIAKTREEFQKFIRDFVGSETFRDGVNTILEIANAFLKVTDSIKPLIPLIATFATFKASSMLIPAFRSFAGSGKRGGIPIGFANGGLVPGSGNGDTVPAMLTPGEFVIRKNSVNKIGAGNLDKINKYSLGGVTKNAGRVKLNKIEKYKNHISNMNSNASNTLILNNKADSVGVVKDKFSLSTFKKFTVTIPDKYLESTKDDPSKQIYAVSGRGGNKGKNFEKYLAENHGLNPSNNEDPQFPFDFVGSGEEYFSDAKDMNLSSATVEDGAKKSLNYLMWKNFENKGYNYAGSNPKISFTNTNLEKIPLNFGKGQFSSSEDLIKFPKEVSFFYPEKEKKSNKNKKSSIPPVESLSSVLKLKKPDKKAFGGAIQYFSAGGEALDEKIGIFDSDQIVGGKNLRGTNLRNEILEKLIESGKPYDVISGPSGAGKSTLAQDKYGKNFVLSDSDIKKYNRFIVISGAGKTSSGEFSERTKGLLSRAGKITVLSPTPEQILRQRELRYQKALQSGVLPDTRSLEALEATKNAPLEVDEKLYNKYRNVEYLKDYQFREPILKQSKIGVAVLESGLEPETYKINSSEVEGIREDKTWEVIAEGLSPETFITFRDGIESGLVEGLKIAAKKSTSIFANDLGLKRAESIGDKEAAEFLSTINRGSYGLLFEQVLMLNKSGKFKNEDPGRPFDFTEGIDNLMKDDYKSLAGIKYVDAKSSFRAAKKEEIIDKIRGEYLKERKDKEEYEGNRYLDASLERNIKKREKIAMDLERGKLATAAVSNMSDFINELNKHAYLDPKKNKKVIPIAETLFGDVSLPSNVTQLLNLISKNIEGFGSYEFSSAKAEGSKANVQKFNLSPTQQQIVIDYVKAATAAKMQIRSQEEPKVSNYASGGSVFQPKGTDTVPAMLTPGEFVINKKSAQQIGYSNLNRMNKVGKYAQGGRIQYLASGGSLGKRGSVFDANQQSLQLSLFLNKYKNILDPKQIKLLEGVIRGIINAGLDAEKAMEQMAKDIDILAQNPNILASYLRTPQNIKEKRSKYLQIGREGKEERERFLDEKRIREEYIGKLRELADSSGRATTNMILMAGAAESVLAQFSGMSESYKAAASAFGSSLAIYNGIGSQLKSFGANVYASIRESQNEKLSRISNSKAIQTNTVAISQNTLNKTNPSIDKLQKTFSFLDNLLLGFSVGMAASSAAIAYYTKEADQASKTMSEAINKFREDFKSVSQAELSESIKNSFLKEGQAKTVGGGLSSSGGMAAVGSFAAAGLAIGSRFSVVGSIIGTVAGALTGFVVALSKFNSDFSNQRKTLSESANGLTTALYQTAKSTLEAKKFIEDSKDKDLNQTVNEIDKTVRDYGKTLQILDKSEIGLLKIYKSFGEMPDIIKNSLDDTAKSLNNLKNQIDQIIGIAESKTSTQIGLRLGTAKYSPVEDIQKITEGIRKNISDATTESVNQQYRRQLSGFKQRGLDTAEFQKKISILAKTESQTSQLEFAKRVSENSIQIGYQNLAMAKELQIREALLGVLSEQLALESQISNINYSLDKMADASRTIEALYSGTVSGLKSNTVPSSVLDIKNPSGENISEIQKAIKSISEFSPLANNIARSISDFNKIGSDLDMIMESINYEELGRASNVEREQAVTKIIKQLPIDPAGESAKAIRDIFEKTFNVKFTGSREGGYSREERQKLLKSNRLEVEKSFYDLGKAILDVTSKEEQIRRDYLDKLTQSQQKEIEIRLSAIDSQKNYLDLIQKASTGKGLTLQQSDIPRFARQKLLAGQFAGNPREIGKQLTIARESLKNAITDNDKQKLQTTVKQLEMALSDLADQSSRTSDIMSKIEEFRAQRETLTESAKDYAFATQEEKGKIDESIFALRNVLASGNINSIPEELRGAIKDLLTKFKDIPIFNGATGFQIENELAAREFQKSGNFDIAAMLRSQLSSPERMLIAELQRTGLIEMNARSEMLSKEIKYQNENTQAISRLTLEIQKQTEEAINAEKRNKDKITASQKEFGAAPKDPLLLQQIKELEDSVKSIDKALRGDDGKGGLRGAIDNTVDGINAQIKRLSASTGRSPAKLNKSSGGLIYRADGGSIFKPRGTDTVPAMLTPGEYVIKKKSVDQIGTDALDAINAGYFSRGGRALYIRRARARAEKSTERFLQDVKSPINKFLNFSPESLSEVPPTQEKMFQFLQTKSQQDIQAQNLKIQQRAELGRSIISSLPKKSTRDEDKIKRNQIIEDVQRRNVYATTQPQEISKSFKKTENPDLVRARELSALDRIDINPIVYESKGITKEQYVTQLYGSKKPQNLSLAVWYDRIAKVKNQERQNFYKKVSRDAQESRILESNYGKTTGSAYTYQLQKSIDEAKNLGSKADAMMAKKFGIESGKNYRSSEDVPVLMPEQVGETVSLKKLKEMEKRSQSSEVPFYYSGANLTESQIMANQAYKNFKPQFTGRGTVSGYLNAKSKLKMLESVKERYANYNIAPFNQFYAPAGKYTPAGMTATMPFRDPTKDLLNFSKTKKLPTLRSSGGGIDSVPAMLTPGEYVINSKSVGKYGKAFMDHLNRGGKVPGFARGGSVSSSVANSNAQFRQNGGMISNQMGSANLGTVAQTQNLIGLEEFGSFVARFEESMANINNMTMNHHLTVDGQLNIAGIDGNAIAAQISTALGQYVGNIVQQYLNKQNRRPGT